MIILYSMAFIAIVVGGYTHNPIFLATAMILCGMAVCVLELGGK